MNFPRLRNLDLVAGFVLAAALFLQGSMVLASSSGWTEYTLLRPSSVPSGYTFTESISGISSIPGSGGIVVAGSAVGHAPNAAGGQILPFVEIESGGSVHDISPSFPGTSTVVNSVSALASNDVWIVGSSQPGNKFSDEVPSYAFADHWNGSAWQLATLPTVAKTVPGSLYSVSEDAPNDVWATGFSGTKGAPTNFMFHWNGVTWTSLQEPLANSYLQAVEAFTPNNVVFLIGSTVRKSPVMQVWNGSTFTNNAIPLQNGGAIASPTFLSGNSGSNLWIAVQISTPLGQQTGIYHWNGTAFSTLPNFRTVSGGNFSVTSVGAVGSNDVWVSGITSIGRQGKTLIPTPFIQHFNGTSWTVVEITINGKKTNGEINAVTPVSQGTVAFAGITTPENGFIVLHTGNTLSPLDLGTTRNSGFPLWLGIAIVVVVVLAAGITVVIMKRRTVSRGQSHA
ncbi:MAG: hypothetical protein ACP5OR_00905 [Candidatus Dormibacteria bacterium]